MKPVKQTVFGYPNGNCYAACVASLLELDLAEMPVIPGPHDPEIWNKTWDAWFASRGIARICFGAGGGWVPTGWHISSGVSPRVMFTESGERVYHSVVARDGKFVHDPHPSDLFLEDEPTDFDIFYPLDPVGLRDLQGRVRSDAEGGEA